MLLANEENVAFFRLFDDLTINIPSAIKVWTSDGLSVLTLCFKKWKTIDFLLSLKDPSRWVERGGSGSRDIGKQYWDLLMIEVLSIVTYQINLLFVCHYLLSLLDLNSSFFSVTKFEIFCFVIVSSNLCGLFQHSSINLYLTLTPSFTEVNKYVSPSIFKFSAGSYIE